MVRLTEGSEAVSTLRRKFASKKYTAATTAKDAWESEECFKKHPLDNFRTKFNKLKKEYCFEAENGMFVQHLYVQFYLTCFLCN